MVEIITAENGYIVYDEESDMLVVEVDFDALTERLRNIFGVEPEKCTLSTPLTDGIAYGPSKYNGGPSPAECGYVVLHNRTMTDSNATLSKTT